MADKCEAWIGGEWKKIDIPTALEYPDLAKRCVECHGAVRIHRAGPGVSAHAEHRIGTTGCTLAQGFLGKKFKHPSPALPGNNNTDVGPILAEEIFTPDEYIEGTSIRISVNAYERDTKARKECLRIHGYRCAVCKIKLSDVYGKVASKIIHVHHVIPLSTIKREYKVNPQKDLRPVCPNCHAIIHSKSEPYSIEQVQMFITGMPA